MKTTSEILCGLLVLGLSSAALAYPDGAPGCVINEQRISKMGGKNTNLGYTITPSAKTFQPNKPIVLTLGGSAPFKGLLMFAEGADPKTRNGNFVIPTGYKTNKPICDSQGYKAGPNGAITQTSADSKEVGAKFTWTPDKCETVTIRAVVVGGSKSSWQVTEPVKLTCAGGAAPATGSGDTPAVPSAGNTTSTPAPPSAGDSAPAPSDSKDTYGGAAPAADSKDQSPGHKRKHKKGKGKACKKNPAGESQGDKSPSSGSKDVYEGGAPKSPESGKPSGGDTPSSAEPKAPATPPSGADTSSGETPESPSGGDTPATPSGSETSEKSTPAPSGGDDKPSDSSAPSPAEPQAPATPPPGTDTSGGEPSAPAAPTPAPESGSENASDEKAPSKPCSSKSSPTPTTPAPAPSGGQAPSSGGY